MDDNERRQREHAAMGGRPSDRRDKVFRLTIRTDNAAFEDRPDIEVRRILKDVAEHLRTGVNVGKIRDINGTSVGEWELTD